MSGSDGQISAGAAGRFLRSSVQYVFLTAFGADRLHAPLDMPIAVPGLDVHAAFIVIGREQNWRLLTMTKPPVHWPVPRGTAGRWFGH
jgi:hypothetical protein